MVSGLSKPGPKEWAGLLLRSNTVPLFARADRMTALGREGGKLLTVMGNFPTANGFSMVTKC